MQVLPPPSVAFGRSLAAFSPLPGVMLGHLIAVGSPKESEEVKEFVAEYASELASLTFNSKPLINTLTMLASENAKAAPSLAAAIEKHVLQVCLQANAFLL